MPLPAMDTRNNSTSDGAPDWNDISMFNSNSFDESFNPQSPYGNSAFNDFTNFDTYSDSPLGLNMLREPSKSGHSTASASRGPALGHSTSAESSSQDSSSESSSRRKRKTASQSPMSETMTETGSKGTQVKKEDSKMSMGELQQHGNFDHNFSQPMHNLTLEQSLSNATASNRFDFGSAASSPIKSGDYSTAASLSAHANMPPSTVAQQFRQDVPVQTINPGMFAMGDRPDQSPGSVNMMFGQASPGAIFSTPSSDSPEAYANNPNWGSGMAQNPAWANDFPNQLTSPGAFPFTPSPVQNGVSPTVTKRAVSDSLKRSPLHIAPISTKSRVETQINVIMTLERPPPGVDHLHLPLHTIAKSKLLAKEAHDKSRVLELHTMLVCTSAMHSAQMKETALRRAAAQNNDEVQRRAEQMRETPEEDRNDPKAVDEADRPANGGEVRICNNCIQRERKRAGRKKTKREEEQQHWERYETERVVVFNSNEYLPFKPCEPGQYPARDASTGVETDYTPPDGAIHVAAAMRIACYCRHQSEKEGFRVIFTMKDQRGHVVAQQISDSILITDDHKTHPQGFTNAMGADGFYNTPVFAPNGLPISHSMVNLGEHMQPFTSSRSHGNLQQLAFGTQYSPQSHVHQLPNSGFTSQTTSATMTPNSLSRPASPSSAGQSGPNKKRKSSSFHRKLPSGLQMTPRVDTSQSPASNMPSAMSINSGFSPGFPGQMNPSYMTIPQNGGPAQYFGSGPPTPSENGPFNFGQNAADVSRMAGNQAYFSHPSSAVPSRASSPVLHATRANMAAYARQPPIQTPTNSVNARSAAFATQAVNEANQAPIPTVTRITPNEGPVSGGTEVVIFGNDFVAGNQIMFGEHVVHTNFVTTSTLVAISPPGRQGAVHLHILPPPGINPYPNPPSKPIFRYIQSNEEMMTMALKFLTEQQYGSPDSWQTVAQQNATNFVQSRVQRAGMQQGYPGGQMMAAEPTAIEDMVLRVLELIDMSESPHPPSYDGASANGTTMLSLACALGMHRVAAALLARGANVDKRDEGGFTPLMQTVVQGHTKIFQLLVARGADPWMRSLGGHSAIDMAGTEDLRDELDQVLLSTRRRRHSRPSLQTRMSYGSLVSSRASWSISSASLYESEMESSQPSTRRPSIIIPPASASVEVPAHHAAGEAMVAWRDALAAQISHFQEHVASTLPNFQLPPLPALPDCRRLGALVPMRSPSPQADPANNDLPSTTTTSRPPRFWEVFSAGPPSAAPSSAAPPPAYHDIFPSSHPPTGADRALKKSSLRTAAMDAVSDEKCALVFDRAADESHVGSSAAAAPVSHRLGLPPSMTAAVGPLPAWFCVSHETCPPDRQRVRVVEGGESDPADAANQMPFLVIAISVLVHALMPYISSILPIHAWVMTFSRPAAALA